MSDIAVREALERLLYAAKDIRSYPAAMAQIGPLAKNRFDGAIDEAEEALKEGK